MRGVDRLEFPAVCIQNLPYLPPRVLIVTAIDQAIKLASGEEIETIPPFTGTLVLRDSVTTGPYYK